MRCDFFRRDRLVPPISLATAPWPSSIRRSRNRSSSDHPPLHPTTRRYEHGHRQRLTTDEETNRIRGHPPPGGCPASPTTRTAESDGVAESFASIRSRFAPNHPRDGHRDHHESTLKPSRPFSRRRNPLTGSASTCHATHPHPRYVETSVASHQFRQLILLVVDVSCRGVQREDLTPILLSNFALEVLSGRADSDRCLSERASHRQGVDPVVTSPRFPVRSGLHASGIGCTPRVLRFVESEGSPHHVWHAILPLVDSDQLT
jgi:hypothetical protein